MSKGAEDALSHLDERGNARMVDVSDKGVTKRSATAAGVVRMKPQTLSLITAGAMPKGDVLSVSRIAGIMAAKRTPELIPLCHPLQLSSVTVDLTPLPETSSVEIRATVTCTGQTGVEMEAITAVSVAAVTLYDMCKAVDKGMRITDIRLLEKQGGRSGHYRADDGMLPPD